MGCFEAAVAAMFGADPFTLCERICAKHNSYLSYLWVWAIDLHGRDTCPFWQLKMR